MDSWVFEVAAGGDGLKNFCIDSPTAAAKPVNEQRGNQTENEISGVKVATLFCHRFFAFDSMPVFFGNYDAAPVYNTNRFDDSHQAIGDGPVDLGQVPVLKLQVRFGVNAGGRFLREAVGLAQ